MKKALCFFLLLPVLLSAETIQTDGAVFHCRIPETCHAGSKIMVLFGGKAAAYGKNAPRKIPESTDAAFRSPLYSETLTELWLK